MVVKDTTDYIMNTEPGRLIPGKGGKMYKAWFINVLGHSFSKEFTCGKEMEEFIFRAEAVGTKLIAFVGI